MWDKRKVLQEFFTENSLFLWVTFGLSLLTGVLTIAIPVAVGKYYDFLFGYQSFKAKLLDFVPLDLDEIRVFLTFFIGLVIFKTIFSFFEKYAIGILGERFIFQVRNLLFQYQLHIPISDYEDKGSGRYLLRFSGDLNSLKKFLTHGIIRFTSDVLLILLAIGLLFDLHWKLGLFMLFGLLIPLLVVLGLNPHLSVATRKQRNSKSKLLAFTSSRLQAIQTIQLFNKEIPEQVKFSSRAEVAFRSGIQYQKMLSLINALIPGLLYLLLSGLFAVVYWLNIGETNALGSHILIFIILLLTIFPVIRRLLKVNVVWELGNISFEKLLRVMNRGNKRTATGRNLKCRTGSISIRDLTFKFRDAVPLFHSLSFDMPGGKLCLVKGGPGIGKTTLIKLITGLYQAPPNTIRIDGQSISKVNGKSLRRKISVVSSEFPLLGKTVFEAISYSRKAEKRRVAQLLLNYLQNNNPELPPLSLNDPIGERACLLSKGQRKLLAFARAVLTGKKILLLDEPLEGLLPHTFPFWIREIQQLAKGKTVVLFSAHDFWEDHAPHTIIDLNSHRMETHANRRTTS